MGIKSLTRAEDFKRLFKAGVTARAGGVTITSSPGACTESRLGLAVRAPRAVDRNRVKRRLRAACHEALRGDPRPLDLAVRARAEAASTPFQELVNAFRVAARS